LSAQLLFLIYYSCFQPLINGIDAAPEIWDVIRGIKSGEKGDLMFIKHLCIIAFGPEILAASSIKGTKRGIKKGEDKEPRPPLNNSMVQEVFGM
jgi:hypothetical protein